MQLFGDGRTDSPRGSGDQRHSSGEREAPVRRDYEALCHGLKDTVMPYVRGRFEKIFQ
jgi:hypothetical protein